jgi:MFS family permease
VSCLDYVARQAFVPELVEREDLPNAIAIFSAAVNAARLVGPGLGGLIVAAIGEGWCFLGNSVSYLAVIAGLLVMKLPPTQKGSGTSAMAQLGDGFRFVRAHAPIRSVVSFVAFVGMTSATVLVVLPIFASRILHGDARSLGILGSAVGTGAIGAALTLARHRGTRRLIDWLPLAGGGFGLGVVAFSASRSLLLSSGVLVFVGFCSVAQTIIASTYIQSIVPDQLRGRVLGVYTMLLWGLMPVGSLVTGWFADRVGAPITVAVGGGMSAVAGAIFRLLLSSLGTRADIDASSGVDRHT